jgi:carbon-monoxide dehydrogenase medium subunit
VFPSAFEYRRAGSIDEAVTLLARHGEDARPLTGGQSLIPLMKLRLVNPTVLVDLNPIPDLDYVRRSDASIEIGALARHSDIERSSLVRSELPIALDAAMCVGDAQVRNLGSLAGAAAEADPGGDWGPVLVALGAQMLCTRPAGSRSIRAEDFYLDYLTTALEPAELIEHITLPLPPPGSGGAYMKLERRSGDFAVVGAAVQLTMDANGMCRDIGIGLAGVGATPIKPVEAEAVLRGSALTEEAIAEAVHLIDRAIDPVSDVRAGAEYRREMAGVYFRRALARARERAPMVARE